jgi:hypothetical protein
MARKRSTPADAPAKAVTAERAARLYRLVTLVHARAQTRDALCRRLRLDLRGFYRDLELLRLAGIDLPLVNRRYTYSGRLADVLARLPFPDPHLTLGEAVQLARGRTKAHAKLRAIIKAIES